jgi:hypothetical protein
MVEKGKLCGVQLFLCDEGSFLCGGWGFLCDYPNFLCDCVFTSALLVSKVLLYIEKSLAHSQAPPYSSSYSSKISSVVKNKA